MSPAEQKELFGLNQHISELMSLYDQYKMPNKNQVKYILNINSLSLLKFLIVLF